MNQCKRKFTNSQVVSIRKSQQSAKQLAKKYGVTSSTISSLRTGRTYKKVGGWNNPWQRAGTLKKITKKQKDLIVKYLKKGTVSHRGIAKIFKLNESYIYEIAAKLGVNKKNKKNTKYNKITEVYLKALYIYLDNYRLVSEESGIPLESIHHIIQIGRHGYR